MRYNDRLGTYNRTSRRSYGGRGWGLWGGIIGVVVLFVVVLALIMPSYFKTKTVTATVNDKERVCDGNSNGGTDCKYLVFTDKGTFRITDALFGTVRFNSSDLYGQIDEDCTYDIKYYGWRIPMLSEYPNIKSITEVSCDE